MKNNTNAIEKQTINKKAISLTTYRALYLAKLLSIKDLSLDEIAQSFSNDTILAESCHKETIANTINTLREVGFEIEKPKASNNYKYQLLSVPFKTELTEDTAEILNILRESLYHFNDYSLLFKINSAYDLILKYTTNETAQNIVEISNQLKNIDKYLFNEILSLCNDKAEAKIIYDSPQNGKEELRIKAQKIVFENNKLYLWLYNYKYQTPAYLRLDRISSLKRISSSTEGKDCMLSCPVEYELYGDTAKKFIPLQNEIVTEKLVDKITVRADVINSFNFFQRIIVFGDECKILSPNSIKEAYMRRINKILEKYE